MCAKSLPSSFSLSTEGRSIKRCFTPISRKNKAALSWRNGQLVSDQCFDFFSEVFGSENVEIKCYGNVLASIALLEGISAEELKKEELLYSDNNYQLLITVKAVKKNFKNE